MENVKILINIVSGDKCGCEQSACMYGLPWGLVRSWFISSGVESVVMLFEKISALCLEAQWPSEFELLYTGNGGEVLSDGQIIVCFFVTEIFYFTLLSCGKFFCATSAIL